MKHYILLLILTAICWCCSNQEDITPSYNDRNMFDMPDFSSPEEMKIRKDFYEETGSYLIFNDSLYYRNLTTPQGSEPELVVLDLKYQISGTNNDSIRYSLLQNMEDKQLAVKFVKEEILPRLSPKFYSYTFFMVDKYFKAEPKFSFITWKDEWTENPAEVYTGYNATLVAYNDFYNLNDTERYAYARKVVAGVMTKNHTQIDDSEYEEFYQYSKDRYGINPGYDADYLALGFILTSDPYRLPYMKDKDLCGFVIKIFELTEQEFEDTYGAYETIMKKKEALVKIFERHGVTVY